MCGAWHPDSWAFSPVVAPAASTTARRSRPLPLTVLNAPPTATGPVPVLELRDRQTCRPPDPAEPFVLPPDHGTHLAHVTGVGVGSLHELPETEATVRVGPVPNQLLPRGERMPLS